MNLFWTGNGSSTAATTNAAVLTPACTFSWGYKGVDILENMQEGQYHFHVVLLNMKLNPVDVSLAYQEDWKQRENSQLSRSKVIRIKFIGRFLP